MMNYRATDDPSGGQVETNIPIISLRLELNWDHQKAIDNYSIHAEDLNLLYSEDSKLLLASLGVRQHIGTPKEPRRVVVWQDHLLGTISSAQPVFRQQESAYYAEDSHLELTAEEVEAEREATWQARQAALHGDDAVESISLDAGRLEVGTDAYDPPVDRVRPEMKDAETDLPDFVKDDDSVEKVSREIQGSRQASQIPVKRDAAPPRPPRGPPTRKLTRVAKRDKVRIEPTTRVVEPHQAPPRVRKTYEPGCRVLKGMSYAEIEEYYVDKVEGLPLQLKRTQDPDYTGHYDYNHIDLGSSYVCYVGDAHGFDNYYQAYPENKGAFFDTCCAGCVDEHEFDGWPHAPGYLDLDEFTRSELLGDDYVNDVETESGGFTKKNEDSTDDTLNEDLASTVEDLPPPEGRRSGSLDTREETARKSVSWDVDEPQEETARKSVSWDVDEPEPVSNPDE
ncbi:MAG: uncharacterized protein KVP18_001085 [Porospora cf. gigantea A]|nr:MAG: hypothetical protein KVP18_001085 [Porospora cf. gigantea A]